MSHRPALTNKGFKLPAQPLGNWSDSGASKYMSPLGQNGATRPVLQISSNAVSDHARGPITLPILRIRASGPCGPPRRARSYNVTVRLFISAKVRNKARDFATLFTELGTGVDECDVLVQLWNAASKGSR
jgi:hypothetical protein